jgi:hypothetical protein
MQKIDNVTADSEKVNPENRSGGKNRLSTKLSTFWPRMVLLDEACTGDVVYPQRAIYGTEFKA